MALKDYTDGTNNCIINNHSEFVKLMKWFLRNGAENCYGSNVPMFENMWDILEELNVKYEDWDIESENEDDMLMIKNISELENFLLNNINEYTLVPDLDEYPILASWYKEENWDRFGDSTMKILTFTSLNTIKPMKNYLIDCMQNIRKEKNKWRGLKPIK